MDNLVLNINYIKSAYRYARNNDSRITEAIKNHLQAGINAPEKAYMFEAFAQRDNKNEILKQYPTIDEESDLPSIANAFDNLILSIRTFINIKKAKNTPENKKLNTELKKQYDKLYGKSKTKRTIILSDWTCQDEFGLTPRAKTRADKKEKRYQCQINNI